MVDASGHNIPELLEAILKFFPLDTYVFNPVVLMDLVNSDKKKDMEVICENSPFDLFLIYQVLYFQLKLF